MDLLAKLRIRFGVSVGDCSGVISQAGLWGSGDLLSGDEQTLAGGGGVRGWGGYSAWILRFVVSEVEDDPESFVLTLNVPEVPGGE